MSKLVLASTSPRRKEILQSLKLDFSVFKPVFDENSVKEQEPVELCKKIAKGKALSACSVFDKALIFSADTLVFCGDCIFGKPKTRIEAKEMLLALSGAEHRVVTALCCIDCKTGRIVERQSISRVWFKKMSSAELDFYLDTEEWKGVAGAYRIQERGAFFIKRIEGSYSNIVGLPIDELYEILKNFDFSFNKTH